MKRSIGAVVVATVLALSLASCAKSNTQVLPQVSSAGFGTVPEITFPSGKAPDTPVMQVLETAENTGPEVGPEDLVLVDYYGRIWNGPQLPDTTITDGSGPVTISLAKAPISGWKQLAGAKVGDRVMLLMPPPYAYGANGSQSLNIPADSTLVYVVDIRAAVDPQTAKDFKLTAAADPLPYGIKVSGNLDSADTPQVTIPVGQPYPTEPQSVLVATGSGEEVLSGQTVAVRMMGISWDGSALPDSWSNGELIGVNADAIGAVGKSLGSQIMIISPADSGALPTAQLMQIVGAFPTTR